MAKLMHLRWSLPPTLHACGDSSIDVKDGKIEWVGKLENKGLLRRGIFHRRM
jgi:hypothetical protein